VSDHIDLLPASYRARIATRRARTERIVMAIPILLGLIGTDLLLRSRLRFVRLSCDQAQLHAAQGQRLADNSRELTAHAQELQHLLAAKSAPFIATRMTHLLDELLADRPDDVHFQELYCRHDPWSPASRPTIHLSAAAGGSESLAAFSAALRTSEVLPDLICRQTEQSGSDGPLGFRLESTGEASPR
jgi:hypothetical protein